ncbi:unnamed protein product, partial [Iphiclides podalirius]
MLAEEVARLIGLRQACDFPIVACDIPGVVSENLGLSTLGIRRCIGTKKPWTTMPRFPTALIASLSGRQPSSSGISRSSTSGRSHATTARGRRALTTPARYEINLSTTKRSRAEKVFTWV